MVCARPAIAAFVAWVVISFSACVIPEANAQVPAGYYDSVDTTNAESFRRSLHDVIDDHKRFPYSSSSTDTWDILEKADEDPNNSQNIIDLYRNTSIPKQGGGNSFYNREHTWPKSYGFPDDRSSNYPYTDCHALFLCDSGYNSARSNKPYRICSASCREKPTEETNDIGGGTSSYPGNSNWTEGSFTSGGWETWEERRGDVARALFYMDVRYEGGTHSLTNKAEPDLILTDNEALIAASKTGSNEPVGFMGMLSVLLAWHEEDPVDARETRRNEIVYGFQGNRNPFIDQPEWVAVLFGGETPQPPPADTTWINEIHYDNKGTDSNEFVEIAGPAGADLSGWRLFGYNGKTGRWYKVVELSGTFPDQGSSMGTLAFDFPRMQNGKDDGLALVNPDDVVVEFLSYEGKLQASNGPAQGTESTDIGVSERENTPEGHSLQRVGSGSVASNHTWQAAMANTKGQINTGQSI